MTITDIDIIKALSRAGLLKSHNEITQESHLISSITYNSKDVKPGSLFVCKGAHFREDYLRDAISRGATCYVSEREYNLLDLSCMPIIVSDIRCAMPIIAKAFYGDLSSHLHIIGITGTKGKSSTTYFMRYIVNEYMKDVDGKPSAICSGIENYDGVINEESHLTTPEIMELYYHMNNAINSGIEYMTMEVSSQALKYNRVDGIKFDVGAFLNIGTDHISDVEHRDFEDYFSSKLRLFSNCHKACYNLDSEELDRIREAASHVRHMLTFSSKNSNANLFAYDIASDAGKVTFKVKFSRLFEDAEISDAPEASDESFSLGTFGTINIENALAAITISLLLGIPIPYIKSGLEKAKVPGRMEVFYSKNGKKIAIVDYAHNKLSYEKLFETIRNEFPGKKLYIVFGCPGDKAYARREELGTIAGLNSDYAIITEDDCGEEDVNDICQQIANYVEATNCKYEILTDRVEAIKKAISMMDENSILILPGKGRETRLKRGTVYVDAPSDAETVMKYL